MEKEINSKMLMKDANKKITKVSKAIFEEFLESMEVEDLSDLDIGLNNNVPVTMNSGKESKIDQVIEQDDFYNDFDDLNDDDEF